MDKLKEIVLYFDIEHEIIDVKPLGEGLINDTFKVYAYGFDDPKYVLQRINNSIFKDVDMLQDNINKVTEHIRKKLVENNTTDVERKVLRFINTKDNKNYYFDGTKYWRLMTYISDSYTYQCVTPEYSYTAGLAFGNFQYMLSDLSEPIGETIPDFHNIELRLAHLRDAVSNDVVGRVKDVKYYIDEIAQQKAKLLKNKDNILIGREIANQQPMIWALDLESEFESSIPNEQNKLSAMTAFIKNQLK